MNAPHRAAEVNAIVTQHANLFGTDDSRRGILYYVCTDLNRIFGDQWGVLEKRDQGGFIPSDIIMWADTREVIDVLGGGPDRAIWLHKGVPDNAQWVWKHPDAVKPAEASNPLPSPSPSPPPAPDPPIEVDPNVALVVEELRLLREPLQQIVENLAFIGVELQELREQLDAQHKDGTKVRL